MKKPLLILFVATFAWVEAALPDSVAKMITEGNVSNLPSVFAVGLCDPDPLMDVAYFTGDRVEVYRNLGNGYFDCVFVHPVSMVVARMQWQRASSLNSVSPDVNCGSDLKLFFTDGHYEVISHEQILQDIQPFASRRSAPMIPELDFREVWRSPSQIQPVLSLAVDDIDGDSRFELGYCFVPQFGDSFRFAVFECLGDDSFGLDWDTVLSRGYGPWTITDVDSDGHKEFVITKNGQVDLLECYGPRQYKYYTTNISYSAPPFKVLQTDINHDGIRELCLLTSNPSVPSGENATRIYIAEVSHKDTTTMWFNIQTAQYYYYTFDMAVGQIDGGGVDEILLAGGPFGVYLWYNGSTWIVRYIYTGLHIGATAPMFVNLDSDPDLELFVGGIGPIGHGSCYALDYIGDTTWAVLWVDSSLQNTPLSVNAGVLDGQFIVAGANTWDRSPSDTLYTRLHVYLPSGVKLGIWRRDSASVQNFQFLDIDNDGRTNLVTPVISHLIPDHLGVYEYFGTNDVSDDGNEHMSGFGLSQNYPNPFNATTWLLFSLCAREHVRLEVYDVLGQRVATLFDRIAEPGQHRVEFNGANLSSGIYFYRLFSDKATLSRKMLLLK